MGIHANRPNVIAGIVSRAVTNAKHKGPQAQKQFFITLNKQSLKLMRLALPHVLGPEIFSQDLSDLVPGKIGDEGNPSWSLESC